MDEEPQLDSEFVHNSTTGSRGSASTGTGMFSGSQHFTVTGENLTNITNNYPAAPTLPSDFRIIPLGDVDLQQEIRLDKGTGGVNRQCRRLRIRRVYSARARVDGRKSSVTVAMYQGPSAEEKWRQDIARYMTVRHPNIIQVCGAASSGNIHAILFHDDLIPLEHFMDLYRHAHFSQVYTYACGYTDFQAARDYLNSAFEQDLHNEDCTFWIRRSTGRLCTDLIPPDNLTFLIFGFRSLQDHIPDPQGMSLSASNTEAAIIESLTLEQYHEICSWNLKQLRPLHSSSTMVVNMGAVLSCPLSHGLEDCVEIATLPSADIHLDPWTLPSTDMEVTEDGWTRFNSYHVSDNIIWLHIRHTRFVEDAWLSQANYIFSRLGITSNFEDYVLTRSMFFNVDISASADPPPGYLFLCPAEDFQIGPSSFCWPDCVAYWSLDPSGAKRLSTDEATSLGFPSIQFRTTIEGPSWDSGVYAGIRRFHQAKGFDPESQDLARYLGKPLYQLASEVESSFAYVDDPEEDSPEPPNMEDSEDLQSSSNEDNAHQSPARSEAEEPNSLPDQISISRAFKITMNVQSTLIVFLALCWLRVQMQWGIGERWMRPS